jgi:flagellar hook assembly protein FlgD
MRQGAWLALASWVVVAAVCRSTAEAGVLSGVGAIPDPFSPNGDALYDSTAVHYTLSDTAAVIVSVADSSLAELAVLWAGWEGAGAHRHWWNGRLGGSVAPDGRYALIVQALPEQGGIEQAAALFRLDTEAPSVTDLDAAPARFSPDADGVADTLFVSGAALLGDGGDRIRVLALDADGSPVRGILAPSGAGAFSARWDGRTDAGAAAADGLYSIVAEAWDLAGNSAELSVLVDLDVAPPYLGASWPDTAVDEFRVADTLAVIAGWAFDRAGVRAVEISRDGATWTDIAASGADTVSWSHALVCAACASGSADETATVRVRAYDGAATADGLGHVNVAGGSEPPLSLPVVFDVAGPVHEQTTVPSPGPHFAPGQTITISTRWDAAGYDVAADFSRVDSEFDPGDVQITDSGGGSYLVKYATSESNSLLPVAGARVFLSVTDAFARSVTDSTAVVWVERGSQTGEAFALDRNAFDPAGGESVTVGLGADAGDSTVEIYTAAGALVRTLETAGASSVEWDGRNDDGETLASGVYVVRIRTDAGSAVRRVALVK